MVFTGALVGKEVVVEQFADRDKESVKTVVAVEAYLAENWFGQSDFIYRMEAKRQPSGSCFKVPVEGIHPTQAVQGGFQNLVVQNIVVEHIVAANGFAPMERQTLQAFANQQLSFDGRNAPFLFPIVPVYAFFEQESSAPNQQIRQQIQRRGTGVGVHLGEPAFFQLVPGVGEKVVDVGDRNFHNRPITSLALSALSNQYSRNWGAISHSIMLLYQSSGDAQSAKFSNWQK